MEGALEKLIKLSAEGARRKRRISQAKGQSRKNILLDYLLIFLQGCLKKGQLFIFYGG